MSCFVGHPVYKYLESANKNVAAQFNIKSYKKSQLYHLREMIYYVIMFLKS